MCHAKRKLTNFYGTNSGPTTKLRRRDKPGKVGPLPVLQTFGQRAVLLAGGIQKERVIVPWTGRRCWVTGVSSSDAPVLDDLTTFIFSIIAEHIQAFSSAWFIVSEQSLIEFSLVSSS
jgi:hypothetical protein